MLSPANETELSEAVTSASGPLRIVGGGTRSIGAHGVGEVLSVARLSGISLYEPGALTIVAGAGTPLAEVEAALAAEGQRLPFEPPHLGALLGRDGASTIGGVVATNAAGPRRMQAGACRDSLIGVRFVDGAGTVLKNGGRVMKNVTGYDLVKLMAGSWGTLGVMSEVAFKVLPKLDGATVVVRGVERLGALDVMTRAVTSPFEVSGAAAVPTEGVYLRLEGLDVSVRYRTNKLLALLRDLGEIEIIDDPATSAALWHRLRDVTDFAQDTGAVWRVSMKPTDMVSGLLAAMTQVVDIDYRLDWAGGLAWIRLCSDAAEAAAGTLETGLVGADAGTIGLHNAIQDAVTNFGGHATLFKAPHSVLQKVSIFQPESAGVAALSRGLRQRFDPRGILNASLMDPRPTVEAVG